MTDHASTEAGDAAHRTRHRAQLPWELAVAPHCAIVSMTALEVCLSFGLWHSLDWLGPTLIVAGGIAIAMSWRVAARAERSWWWVAGASLGGQFAVGAAAVALAWALPIRIGDGP
jgi:hypothetical protein